MIWDVDGTLTNSTDLIADALDHVYLKFFGRTLSYEERCALIGTPLWKQIRVFGEPSQFGADDNEITAEFIHYYETNRHRELILAPVIEILIDCKHRGLPTALVTSKNREELSNTLPRLGISDWLDAIVTADDVANPKPSPEGIKLALNRCGIPEELASNAVYIGDTTHDMSAARAAGVRAIGVAWGAAGRVGLSTMNPDFICGTPDDLKILLERLRSSAT